MPQKGSTDSLAPSGILADAVNAFTKAASLAFAAVEEQAKLEVAQLNVQLAELRRERDKNLKFMNQTQLQEKDWERHGEMLKTSLEKSELTIKHQADTIVQLRDEVTQWKNQLLRLEETSRREIRDWKEQYLRTEQERVRLSARIDEMVAEQLQNATQKMIPRASSHMISEAVDSPAQRRQPGTARRPRPSMPSMPSDSEEAMPPPRSAKPKPTNAQTNTDRERTYVEMPPNQESVRDAPVRTQKHRPVVDHSPKRGSTHKASFTPRASTSRTDYHAHQQPQQHLIRRVHAVVEVPVKEEVYSDEEDALVSDGSDWQPEKRNGGRQRRRSSIKSKPYVEIDEHEEDDDDDDQLLIGAEENPNEIYGTQRIAGSGQVRSKQRPRSTGVYSGTSKKRKLDVDSIAASRISTTKVARKKQ